MSRLRKAVRRARQDDAGFGLIEMVVALLIAGLVFSALASTLMSALNASLLSRQNQQAADYMTRALENARLLDYGSLSTSNATFGTDPRVSTCAAGGQCLDVQGTSEVLVTSDVPGIDATQPLLDDATNGTRFTLHVYVTNPASASTIEDVRRVVVYIDWSTAGRHYERSTSTMIAYSQQGLPAPYFELSPLTVGQTITSGAQVVYSFVLANKGAPDRWNLVLGGYTAGFQIGIDTNGDGVWGAGDAIAGDSSGDGIPDTNLVDPGTSVRIFLIRPDSTGAPALALGTYTTTLTATSVAQPTMTGASATATATTTVIAGTVTPSPTPTVSITPEPTCPAPAPVPTPSAPATYSFALPYWLHNGTGSSNLLTQLDMSDTNLTFNAQLGSYSLNYPPADTGRLVSQPSPAPASGGALMALTDPSTYADWEYQFGAKKLLAGTPVVTLWVAGTSGAVPAGAALQAVLYGYNHGNGVRTVIAETGSAPVATCVGFQQVVFAFPQVVTPYSFQKFDKLHLRVTVAGAGALRFGYDATAMPASLAVGTKAG